MTRLAASVVVATRNRKSDLLETLPSFAQQSVLPAEIIIIDSSDVPLTDEPDFNEAFAQEKFPGTVLKYERSEPGLTRQRNAGIDQATGDVVFFFDDDVTLQPDYFEQMLSVFERDPSYGGGMGCVTNLAPRENALRRLFKVIFMHHRDYASGRFTLAGWPTHAFGSTEFMDVEVLGGCCMAFTRDAVAKHRFDESLKGYSYSDDWEMSYRVSRDAPLFYNPAARLVHRVSPMSRDRFLDNRSMYIRNYSHQFFKHFYPRSRLRVLAYWWSVFGLLLQGVMLGDPKRVKGYWIGVREYWRHAAP